jgi:hypothetical protein
MDRRLLPIAMVAAFLVVPQVVAVAAGAAPRLDGPDAGALVGQGTVDGRLEEGELPDGEPTEPANEPDPVPVVAPDPVAPSDDGGDERPTPVEVPNDPPAELPRVGDGELTGDDPGGRDDPAEPRPEAVAPAEVPAEPPSPVPSEPSPGDEATEQPTEEEATEASTPDPGAWVGPAPEGEPSEPAPADEEAAPSTFTGQATPLDDAGSLAGEMLAVSVTTDLGLGEVTVGSSTADLPFSMAVTNVSGAGWQVTVDGADLVHADDPTRTIPRTAMFLVGGSGDGTLATEITPHAGFLPEDGALLLVHGTAAASGQFVLVDGPTLRLDVPSDAVPGIYRTMLTYTIMSRP